MYKLSTEEPYVYSHFDEYHREENKAVKWILAIFLIIAVGMTFTTFLVSNFI